MVGKYFIKILIFVSLAAVLLPGAGALDNITVIERYPDGQPMHITHTLPLVENSAGMGGKILKPGWTCPPDEIPSPVETSIIEPRMLNGQSCKVLPKPDDYIYYEGVERWLNSYGQTQKISYLDRDGKVQAIIPDTVDSALVASNWEDLYIDENGEVVSYVAAQDIPSNKTKRQAISFQGGYTMVQAMQDLKLTQADIMAEKNYDAIKMQAYNHTPEAMQKRIAELEGKQIPEIKATVSALNQTVARQGGLIENLLNWVNSTFNIDLR